MGRQRTGLDRRDFLKVGLGVAAGGAALGTRSAGAAAADKVIHSPEGMLTRRFGKTGHELPVLGCGGSALIQRWTELYNVPLLSTAERVEMVRYAYERGVRYFDTARNYQDSEEVMGVALEDVRDEVYVASKLRARGPEDVRASVETTLEKLRSDYVDAMQLHNVGDYERGMKLREAMEPLLQEGLIRFTGLTTHVWFEAVYRMISTDSFDQVLLAAGYFRKGLTNLISDRSHEFRQLCLARAHELDMGIVAMKVLGANIMSHAASRLIPGYDPARLKRLPGAAIRWVLQDERIGILNIGLSLKSDVDENLAILAGDRLLSNEDRELLADFSSRAYETDVVKEYEVV